MKEGYERLSERDVQLTLKSNEPTLKRGSIMAEENAEISNNPVDRELQGFLKSKKSVDEAQAERIAREVSTREDIPGEQSAEREIGEQYRNYSEFRRGQGEEVSEKDLGEQIKIIEEVATNPDRFDAFTSSISDKDPESLKQVMGNRAGKIIFGVLLGDIAEREQYYKRFEEIINGDPQQIKDGLSNLAREIEEEEKSRKPEKDPEKAQQIKDAWEKKISELQKKRELKAEEIDKIRNLAERGISPAGEGGQDYEEIYHTLLEEIQNISPEEELNLSKKLHIADQDFVLELLNETYQDNTSAINSNWERWQDLKNIEDPKTFKNRAEELLKEFYAGLEKAKQEGKGEPSQQEREQTAREIASSGEIRKRGMDFKSLWWVGDDFFTKNDVRGVQELGTWIVSSDDLEVWGPGGVYPIFDLDETRTRLIKKQNPDGSSRTEEVPEPIFREENFIRWIRSKALEHHNDNPNDPINLLQSVSIETAYRSISIITMKYNKQKYFSDPKGNLLSNLAEEAVGESFLFGTRRNKDLQYKQVMNSDEKLFDALVELNGKNDHTSGSTLADYLKMGEAFKEEEGGSVDHMVGDAMLAANQIYRNLSDIGKLREILPEDSPILNLEGFKNTARYLNGQDFSEDPQGHGNLFFEGNKVYYRNPKTGVHTNIFDSEGNLVSEDNLIEFLNFFPAATPEETNETFVRELVKQSAAKIVGFDAGVEREKFEEFKREHGDISLQEYRRIIRLNLEWAEVNSWSEQRWNGAAARNDTNYRGYDAWTKMYMQYYRERQSREGTGGPIGNPHDMQIFRMLSPDMWLALRTESGQSVQEVFEELHKINLDLYRYDESSSERQALEEQKKAAYNKLKFPRWTELDWASNGIKRQSEVWHDVLNTEDLEFNELAKKDIWGVLKFDRSKFEEVVKDGFIKKRRYAFSSNSAMNYGAMTRMRERTKVEFNKDGTVKNEKWGFKDKYLADAMFGDVVMNPLKRDWFYGSETFVGADENGNSVRKVAPKEGEEFNPNKHGTFQEYLNSDAARLRIVKNVCRAGIAAQIKAHRERLGSEERWNSHVMKSLYEALQSMPRYIEDPQTGEEVEVSGEQFFSEEDIKWIREQTGTTRAQLIWEDTYGTSWDVLAEGVPGIFKTFFNDVIS